MDQQSNTTPSVRLPQPSFDPMAAQPAAPQFAPAPISAPQMQPQTAPNTQTPVPIATVPNETTAGDAQDEEWIAKAKDIAVQYKNDPFAQSNALSKLRADYLYKQHGMTTKLGEK